MLFDDLLNAADFDTAVNSLAREFRDDHELPAIYQLGLVAPDVEDAARRLETCGVGPFVVGRGAPDMWRERGEERQIRGQMGLAYHQGFEIELLEPAEGSDFYAHGLDPDGHVAVHHLGLAVEDVDLWAKKLAAVGFPTWVRGRLQLGPLTVAFAYVDTVADAGLVIEFIAWRIRGRAVRPAAGTIKDVRRLEKWLGQDSRG